MRFLEQCLFGVIKFLQHLTFLKGPYEVMYKIVKLKEFLRFKGGSLVIIPGQIIPHGSND